LLFVVFIPYYVINVSDLSTIGESTIGGIVNYINVSDSETVADVSAIFVPFYKINVSDSSTGVDSETESISSFINIRTLS
jgi:hypothetical protein